jgi:glycosyltransferase involved in cell wall biosynthesis
MTTRANQRNVRSIMKKVNRGDKLNIFTFATHERYESNLCKTGHNFYSFKYGKEWDTTYAPVPDNYHIIEYVPPELDFDIILQHTSDDRLMVAHDLLSQTQSAETEGLPKLDKLAIPTIRHCHVLPNFKAPKVDEMLLKYKELNVSKNSFISKYNANVWGYDQSECEIIEHGIDTDFWHPDNRPRKNLCLSVVNDWINRDWCCGFGLWGATVLANTPHQLPIAVYGKTPGLSEPARNTNHLRDIYRESSVFLNTSLVSPVPTVLMEAMSCGCAIVSTKNCMIPEIIEHGVNGYMANDPNELRNYCTKLLDNPTLARKMGDAARETIVSKFSLPRFVDNWNNLLYNTIGEYNEGLLRR